MKKVLFTATVVKTHINTFHLPFLKMFKVAGWEVHVAAKNDFINETCVIPNCDRYYNIDFNRFPFSLRNIKAYYNLKKIIQTNKYDIIHCHTPVAGVLTRLAAISCKKTIIIYTAHGFHFYSGSPLINWLIYYPIEKFCARFTDKLITINREDFNRAKNWKLHNNGQVYLVSGVGIDINKFKQCDISIDKKKKKLGIPKNYKIILSVGELNSNKNHQVIIKALAKLKYQDYVYLICGQGILHDELENLIKLLKLSNNVKLMGYRNDINDLLNITDLFVFPSKREGLPLSLMEALSVGVNSLASDIRGNRDLLDEKYLCKSNSVDEWACLIKDNLYQKKRKIVLNESFYLDNVLKDMEKIYGI